jgi:Protein of Unknown function (DUF2784)
MLFLIAANAVLVFHLAFIVFATLGAVLAGHWRWIPYVHLPAVAWAFYVEATGRICPLTYLENDLRNRAGQSGYVEGLMEHYLLATIYPEGLTRSVQYVLAGVVVGINVAIYGWLAARRRGPS